MHCTETFTERIFAHETAQIIAMHTNLPIHGPQDEILPALLEEGLVTLSDIERCEKLAEQEESRSILYFMLQMRLVRAEDALRHLSKHYRVPSVTLSFQAIDPEYTEVIDGETASEFQILPLGRNGRSLRVAMADPSNQNAIEVLEFQTRYSIERVVADPFQISTYIDRSYNRTGETMQRALAEFTGDELVEDVAVDAMLDEQQAEVESAPVVRLIHAMMVEAVKKRASDIHIEPVSRTEFRVRFRVDGVLKEVERQTARHLYTALIQRIKIMADLDIAERRIPQDGRIAKKVAGRYIDFRVSLIPTSLGEKAVLRILDKSAVSLDMETLGFDARGYDLVRRTLASPVGMIVATGPTGAGKTTTLYSMLLTINNTNVNILSAEDPIEYDLEGVSQTEVQPTRNFDFADVLRAALRQDPDVIMVGEMRDLETARIAVRAALTGHLVLTTLHTNDSVSAFTRLIDMGMERFNIVAAITTVIAQRLVRRICTDCKKPFAPPADQLIAAGISQEEASRMEFWHGAGCAECGNTGYRGRIGLYEVLPVTSSVGEMVMNQEMTTSDIKRGAVEAGMETLRQVGMRYVAQGVTTLAEVIAHTPHDNY